MAQWKHGGLGQKYVKADARRAGRWGRRGAVQRGDPAGELPVCQRRFMQALAERWRALPGGSARADT